MLSNMRVIKPVLFRAACSLQLAGGSFAQLPAAYNTHNHQTHTHSDIDWMEAYKNWVPDPVNYPQGELADFIAELHAQGQRWCVSVLCWIVCIHKMYFGRAERSHNVPRRWCEAAFFLCPLELMP